MKILDITIQDANWPSLTITIRGLSKPPTTITCHHSQAFIKSEVLVRNLLSSAITETQRDHKVAPEPAS